MNLKNVYQEYYFYITSWKSYMDDTIACIRTDDIEHGLCILNSFHGNISLTYKHRIKEKISFLACCSCGITPQIHPKEYLFILGIACNNCMETRCTLKISLKGSYHPLYKRTSLKLFLLLLINIQNG